MRRETRRSSLLIVAAAIFAFAVAVGTVLPGPAAAQSNETSRPALIEPISVDDLPAHIQFLIVAAAMRLQGSDRQSLGPVRFTPEALRGLSEPEFDYRGFSLTGAILGEVDKLSDDEKALELNTMIFWQDAMGRRAATSLSLRYEPKASSIVVTDGHVVPVSSGIPEVRLFALPITSDGGDLEAVLTDFGRLVALLSRKGVDPLSLAGTNSNFVLFAVVADRLPASARIRVVPAGAPGDASSEGIDATVINIDGWRVGLIPVLADEPLPRHLKVYYRPSPVLSGEDEPSERLAALFRLSDNPGEPEPRTARAPALAAPITGPAAATQSSPSLLAAPLWPKKSDGAGDTAGSKSANAFENLTTR